MTARGERVRLAESERVVPRGSARTEWYVRRDRSWVKAQSWPGAVVEAVDAGPGTVWERSIFLELPAGAELLRVEVAPRAAARRDPLAYLRSDLRKAPQGIRRTYYTVGRGGALKETSAARPSR